MPIFYLVRILGKILYKPFFLPHSGLEALTPVLGSLLLLLITVALMGAVVVSFNSVSGEENFQSPVAKITLESCSGGLYGVGPTAERVRLEENRIVLIHEGGSSLPIDAVSIRIYGDGNSYQGIPGYGGNSIKGDLSVSYLDMSSQGKNPKYMALNGAVLENGLWDVGEKLILCGQDSSVNAIDSSVKVSVNGVGNTSDNYGFKEGSEITLKVIDTKSRIVLTEQRAVVKHVEGKN